MLLLDAVEFLNLALNLSLAFASLLNRVVSEDGLKSGSFGALFFSDLVLGCSALLKNTALVGCEVAL